MKTEIQTAEEVYYYYTGESLSNNKLTEKAMIKFAKLHVKATLEAIIKKLPYDDKMNRDILLIQDIENAYNLDNIK